MTLRSKEEAQQGQKTWKIGCLIKSLKIAALSLGYVVIQKYVWANITHNMLITRMPSRQGTASDEDLWLKILGILRGREKHPRALLANDSGRDGRALASCRRMMASSSSSPLRFMSFWKTIRPGTKMIHKLQFFGRKSQEL